MEVGVQIRNARIKRGWTKKILAEQLHIGIQTLSKWENGTAQPSAKHFFGLYDIFGDEIFSGSASSRSEEKQPKNYMIGIREIYKIGRGPSSSHTIGPEKACLRFKQLYPGADSYKAVLFGSLAKTGKGHGTDVVIRETLAPVPTEIVFDPVTETAHPNTVDFYAYQNNEVLGQVRVLSVGGGDIIFGDEQIIKSRPIYDKTTFYDIAEYCRNNHLTLWQYAQQTEDGLWDYLYTVWRQMVASVNNGLNDEGILPGGLDVHKKAKHLFEAQHIDESAETKENRLICAYAFAVSEQNASARTIVTAPTCGAAGVLPAVLYYEKQKHHFSDEQIVRALATAGLVGNLIKTNASVSGAECGCQAEIGSACAMASAALGELFELSIDKIEYAAEIALEHHLGLTCDPVCGLVQIPCIERNAVAAMRAINAVSLASLLWSTRKISLDKIIRTMGETGKDLRRPYRETSEGGLAKNYYAGVL